ncbi:MAG: hypothetical protein WCD76_08395 [Pyrinomonadaceae bacterium]
MPSRIVEEFAGRESLVAVNIALAALVPLTVALGFIVKQGDVVGVITSTGLGRRRTRAVAAGSGFATSAATGQVDDASVFAPGDVLKNAAGTTVGTIAAGGVNKLTNVITLTANAAVAVAAGAAVLGSDGSQVAKAISDDETDGTADAVTSVYICGLLKEAKLRGLDSTAKAELGGVSTAGGIFKF